MAKNGKSKASGGELETVLAEIRKMQADLAKSKAGAFVGPEREKWEALNARARELKEKQKTEAAPEPTEEPATGPS